MLLFFDDLLIMLIGANARSGQTYFSDPPIVATQLQTIIFLLPKPQQHFFKYRDL